MAKNLIDTSKAGKYRILNEEVLIEIDQSKIETEYTKKKKQFEAAGLVMADTEENQELKARAEVGCMIGKIVAVGSMAFGHLTHDIPEVGDLVLFGRYTGIELERNNTVSGVKTTENGIWYRLMRDIEIKAVIET